MVSMRVPRLLRVSQYLDLRVLRRNLDFCLSSPMSKISVNSLLAATWFIFWTVRTFYSE